MDFHPADLLRSILGFGSGILIGYAFGLLQNIAWRRHQALEAKGKFKNGWSIMPGSGRRIAYLLIALFLVQVACPLLFVDSMQWFVSAGVLVGYGAMLYSQMRERMRLLAA